MRTTDDDGRTKTLIAIFFIMFQASARAPSLAALSLAVLICPAARTADPACAPAWTGNSLIDCDSLSGWAVEKDSGASGSLQLAPGIVAGQSVELEWDLGTGDWVQARYKFAAPIDLSGADIFGISLLGGGPAEAPNTVGILIADENGVFHGYDMSGRSRGLNQIDRPLVNLPVPKKLLRYFFSAGDSKTIDWSRIDRLFVVVKRPAAGEGGGGGRLRFDHIRRDSAALWPRQALFEANPFGDEAARRAAEYILGQQKATGLIVSWKEEPSPKAWLYDQALGLLVLAREGEWAGGAAANEAALAADRLADSLAGRQEADGRWPRGWNPVTGEIISEDDWIGDQAWCVVALSGYSRRSGRDAAMAAARRGAERLAARIDASGKLTASTEGNADAWWAMVATCRLGDAAKIRAHLDTVWDPDLRYWWRGEADPVIAMDAATWLSALARHPLVGEPEKGLAALGFVRRALAAGSLDGVLCGFDGMGPVAIWNEGTAQYVAAGGEEAGRFLDSLLAQQRPDGSMPGSPESRESDAFGWLTPWSGLAPTAWLCFAVRGLPFPLRFSLDRGDVNGDGGLDIADPLAILFHLFAGGRIENGCGEAVADADGSGIVDIGDPVYLLSHLFLGDPEPPALDGGCDCGGS